MKLQILLSTYNGSAYLCEQLNSLLAQSLNKMSQWEVGITIRDDGSTDGTWDLLERYARENEEICLIRGENKGVIGSFFELIFSIGDDVDYVALSDQDDVWMEDKLERAVEQLTAREGRKPLLYCGKPMLTDEALNPIPSIMYGEQVRPSFGNALIENICTGCTAVCNRKLVELAQMGIPEFVVMHDWWLYLLASCFGEVIFDDVPHMYYRQHQGNVVGVQKNFWREFKARVKRFRGNRYNIHRQVASLEKMCEKASLKMSSDNEKLVKQLLSAKSNFIDRILLVKNPLIFRQRKGDNLIFSLILLMGNM